MRNLDSLDAEKLNRMSAAIEEALTGNAAMEQGLCLAAAVGAWLASHVVVGKPDESWDTRQDIMLWFTGMAWKFAGESAEASKHDVQDTFAGRH